MEFEKIKRPDPEKADASELAAEGYSAPSAPIDRSLLGADLFAISASPDVDLDTLLTTILNQALTVTEDPAGGAVFLHHPNTGGLHLRTRVLSAAPKLDGEATGRRWLKYRGKISSTEASSEQDLQFREVTHDSTFRLFEHSGSIARLWLMQDEEHAGMIQVESLAAGADTADLRRQLEALARIADTVIHRALLRDHATANGLSLCFVGMSPPLLDFESQLKAVGKGARSSVLVTGERGSGKELAAYMIHYHSDRRDRPFVPINSAALSETLFADELFGHEQGAYTGARRGRKGALVAANGGTLFLDEIGDMTPQIQAALLRFLENGELRPIGSDRSLKVDVRIIAATNRDLDQLVREESFRADILDRLNVFHLEVPPLRDRKEDIPLLGSLFMKQACAETKRHERITNPSLCQNCSQSSAPVCTCAALYQRLSEYDFPGNVRELRNVISRLAVLVPEDEIAGSHAGTHLNPGPTRFADSASDLSLDAAIRRHITTVLEQVENNKSAAARALGIPLTTLINKMKRLGMMA